jgi:metal-responsive CopG/Arc/MetJ family transcriptional regulator
MMHDDVIMRTIIDLPKQQLAALGAFCERERISRAEAIRRAVEAWLAPRLPADRASAFGSWERNEDSRKIVDDLRAEWDEGRKG